MEIPTGHVLIEFQFRSFVFLDFPTSIVFLNDFSTWIETISEWARTKHDIITLIMLQFKLHFSMLMTYSINFNSNFIKVTLCVHITHIIHSPTILPTVIIIKNSLQSEINYNEGWYYVIQIEFLLWIISSYDEINLQKYIINNSDALSFRN